MRLRWRIARAVCGVIGHRSSPTRMSWLARPNEGDGWVEHVVEGPKACRRCHVVQGAWLDLVRHSMRLEGVDTATDPHYIDDVNIRFWEPTTGRVVTTGDIIPR